MKNPSVESGIFPIPQMVERTKMEMAWDDFHLKLPIVESHQPSLMTWNECRGAALNLFTRQILTTRLFLFLAWRGSPFAETILKCDYLMRWKPMAMSCTIYFLNGCNRPPSRCKIHTPTTFQLPKQPDTDAPSFRTASQNAINKLYHCDSCYPIFSRFICCLIV